MVKRIKKKPLSIYVQKAKLKQYFPDSTARVDQYGRRLIWEGKLQPSDLSLCYDIKIEYVLGKDPDVYVITPAPLPLPEGEKKLKHTYDHKKQHLCLYYRKAGEWNAESTIADTIIPWTSEWLLHYEFWVLTGEWRGGGIEH